MSADIYDFNSNSGSSDWLIVNDGVMGGLSKSRLLIDESGNGIFSGEVTLENNGGFASVRHRTNKMRLNEASMFVITIKGDGKRYQFRVKSNVYDRHSYVEYFETNGDWQTITIPFKSLQATFRGRTLGMPPFSGDQLEEIGFLVGNGVKESFKLKIDSIGVN